MQLTRKKQTGNLVGLDIEAGSIAATELSVNGAIELKASAIGPLPAGAFQDGEVLDGDSLSAALKSFFAEHKLGKRVRLGIGNQRVVVRMLRMPAIEDRKELEAAVRFQAQEQIPMPLDQAVLEHQVVGGVPAEEGSTPQLDVVVVAARRDMVLSFIRPLRRAGLEPVGVDLSAFGMIRALAGTVEQQATEATTAVIEAAEAGGEAAGAEAAVEDSAAETGTEAQAAPGQRPPAAVLYCNVGDVTNLAVARGRACLFTRVADAGLEAISDRLASARSLPPEQATQWLTHVGLEQPTEEIEGEPEMVTEVRRSLEEGVAALIDELRLSLDYYGAQEGAVPVERIVLSGAGSAIAGLAGRMEGVGLPIAVSRPAALAALDEVAAARLTLPFGLALED